MMNNLTILAKKEGMEIVKDEEGRLCFRYHHDDGIVVEPRLPAEIAEVWDSFDAHYQDFSQVFGMTPEKWEEHVEAGNIQLVAGVEPQCHRLDPEHIRKIADRCGGQQSLADRLSELRGTPGAPTQALVSYWCTGRVAPSRAYRVLLEKLEGQK